jgi:hypothetical protein
MFAKVGTPFLIFLLFCSSGAVVQLKVDEDIDTNEMSILGTVLSTNELPDVVYSYETFLDTQLFFKLNMCLSAIGYEKGFPFDCKVRDVHDRLAFYKKAHDFCYGVLQELPPSWHHYFIEPMHCYREVEVNINKLYQRLFITMFHRHEIDLKAPAPQLQAPQWCMEPSWLWQMQDLSQPSHSQSSQAAVLRRIFSEDAIGPTNKYYVEIGFNSVTFEGGTGSNTYDLFLNGWTGLLLDIENENHTINLWKHKVSADNIVDIFDHYKVPLQPDYVSIDIDSQDLWVLRAILASGKYLPRVISVEFNSNLPFSWTITVMPGSDQGYMEDLMFGASAGALKLVAEEFGYLVVEVIDKLDLILVRGDLIEGKCLPPFVRHFYKRARTHHCVFNPVRMNGWVEYKTWRETGSIETARIAAAEQIALGLDIGSNSRTTVEQDLRCLGIDLSSLPFLI